MFVTKRTHQFEQWPKSQLMSNLKSEGMRFLGTRDLQITQTPKSFTKTKIKTLYVKNRKIDI